MWDCLYEDCLQAATSIEFEQYILMDDSAGKRFLELFARKAAEGVKVRLMLDAVGSRNLLLSPYLEEMRKAGVLVHFYNAFGLGNMFAPLRWLPRNHNKVMLIDGHICHIGSACIWEIMRDWREMHVRVEGPIAAEVRRNFAWLWEHAAREKIIVDPPHMNGDAGLYSYVVSRPRPEKRDIYKRLVEAIDAAQKKVCLATPYFLPPRGLRRALIRAIRRGVEVKVLSSHKTDVPIADCVARSYYPRLQRMGLRIFHFEGSVMHAKYAVIDDGWAMVGSTNMDYLSLLQNREADLIIRDQGAVAMVRDCFDADILSHSYEVPRGFWREMPWPQKLAGYLGRGLRRIL